jgi:DNA-binding CsgD family transcriptional regulator
MALIDQFPYVFQRAGDLKLSKREAEVIGLTATGLRELEIAEQLGISEHTVRNHIENSKRKLNARNKSHAVSIAITTKEIVGG